MAAPSLINLKKGEVISLREFTLPNVSAFLDALPKQDTKLVFIASADYDITNGYSIITTTDKAKGLFGEVIFGSIDSGKTAVFDSISEYGNTFSASYLRDNDKFYFNVTSNSLIDSIYFDIVDADTRSISYTKLSGYYTPLYFYSSKTDWVYTKGHNKSVVPFGIGDSNTVPNNATTTWSPKLSEDCIGLELYNGLDYKELEVVSSVSQVSTSIVLLADWGTHQVVKVNIKNDLTKPIAAQKFTLIVRDIYDKTVYSSIIFNYETDDVPLITNKAIEVFTTNENYGSGTTEIIADKTLQFGFPTGAITNDNDVTNWAGYMEATTDISNNPMYLINSSGGANGVTNSFFQVAIGNAPETGTLSNKPYFKYKPRLSITNTKEQGMIMSQPVYGLQGHGVEPFVKAGKNVINLVTKSPISIASGNTNSMLKGNVTLSTDDIHTIILDQEYPGFNMATSTYQEGKPLQGTNLLTATWDNQQSDLIELIPYIDESNRFCCKIIPIVIKDAVGLVYVQVHNSPYWDNGEYINDTFRFDVVPGANSTVPMEVSEVDVHLTVNDKHEFKIYAPSAAVLSVKSSNSKVASADLSKKTITAKKAGSATITITATMDGFNQSERTINVDVKALPTVSIMNVDRHTIVVDEGSTTQVKVTSERIDEIVFRHNPEAYVDISTDFTFAGGCTNGTFNILGNVEGVEVLTVVGKYKGVEEILFDIEIHVIPKGTYKIVTKTSKIKVDLKKNKYGTKFWATTNAGFLRWEMRYDEQLYAVTPDSGTNYCDANLLFIPLQKGTGSITLYGHDENMATRLIEVSVPVKITKSVEPAKNEIWVAAEHKLPGVEESQLDLVDKRPHTVLKWLERPTLEDVYGHTIYLPQRSGTLLTYKQLINSNGIQKRYFDLAGKGIPTRNLNPKSVGYLYLDTLTGEIWKCMDNTTDSNHWFSMTGKQIGKPEQLIYPKPGAKGFGAGPMSYDLHESYGLEPLPGTYDPWSDEYGNYKDSYGNVYVNIPKHYIKATGSVVTDANI